MHHLDGLYRHRGVTMVWDAVGVTLSRAGAPGPGHAPWRSVIGARRLGTGPGHVQVIVRDHVPDADPSRDPFSIAVASDDDAHRIVSCVEWNAGAPPAAIGAVTGSR